MTLIHRVRPLFDCSKSIEAEQWLADSAWHAYLERRVEAEIEAWPRSLLFRYWPRQEVGRKRGVSPEVVEVLDQFVFDRTAAEIAGILGTSESTINRRLGLGLAVMGCTRVSLPIISRVLARLPCPTTAVEFEVVIHPARVWPNSELQCVLGALSGHSVEELAQARGRSPATVRKQLLHAAHKQGCLDTVALSCRVQFSLRRLSSSHVLLDGDSFDPIGSDSVADAVASQNTLPTFSDRAPA